MDEVYAGDVTPGDLTFQSHVCDWMFLEPGARYLFSTGARIPKRRASDADSVVWRLDSDTASLAGGLSASFPSTSRDFGCRAFPGSRRVSWPIRGHAASAPVGSGGTRVPAPVSCFVGARHWACFGG